MTITPHSTVVGIDVHKFSHTAVVLTAFGVERESRTFTNDQIPAFVAWLERLGPRDTLIVGVEDVHNAGHHLSRALVTAGIETRYVPPILTDRARKTSLTREKTDTEDARRVAQVILSKGKETVPADPIIHDQDKQVRRLDLLVQERRDLVKTQTRIKNQLHALLYLRYTEAYRSRFATCFSQTALAWYRADCTETPGADAYLTDTLVRHLDHLDLVQRQVAAIAKQQRVSGLSHPGVRALVETLPGCGIDTATKIMAEVRDIRRFHSAAALVRYARLAPTSFSSGRRQACHTASIGNRMLNQAINTIALTQITRFGPPEAKAYYRKKQQEGKSNLWAIRCLKNKICHRVYRILEQAA